MANEKATGKCVDCGAKLTGHGTPTRCRSCSARWRYVQKNGASPERIVSKCAVCSKEFSDYASNRRKSKTGEHFCSPECRAAWVGVQNSITRGGDGHSRSKSDKDKLYYRDNADAVRKGAGAYYWKNRDSILARKKSEDRQAKQLVVDAYGGKCECCGESMVEFLTIDHINNDGALHRRKVGKGRRIYKDLIALGFPKDNYRLLCFNCNIARGFYGYCPHKPEDKSVTSHRAFNPGRKRTVK
jgi:hypothetical protein